MLTLKSRRRFVLSQKPTVLSSESESKADRLSPRQIFQVTVTLIQSDIVKTFDSDVYIRDCYEKEYPIRDWVGVNVSEDETSGIMIT